MMMGYAGAAGDCLTRHNEGTAVNWTLWPMLNLLAEAGGGGGGGGGAGEGPGLSSLLLPLAGMALVFYFLFMRPQKREQARRDALLAAVKKNDRVLTVGGVFGVVTNVHREANEITVKVDETTNTKLRMTLSSIAEVLGEGEADDTASK